MNFSLTALFQGARRALAEDVLPATTSDHARTQLAGVLDILGKLEGMVVWSPEAQQRQLDALLRGCAAFAAHAAKAGEVTPAFAQGSNAGIDEQLRVAEAQVMRLTDWLFNPTRTLDANARRELDAILREAMREQLRVERKMIPLTDFASMTAAAEPR
ncbi:hypothetical protein [Caenimonas soli]|uniref:hypothetical protein n=1 Tax=Caenimonas soli TaxID=2735555 RepID=UPI001554BC39|nr:hypothetical protein [Caenimonas soli]NPC54980.1 hypothetical protein [Caenimonas soli]